MSTLIDLVLIGLLIYVVSGPSRSLNRRRADGFSRASHE